MKHQIDSKLIEDFIFGNFTALTFTPSSIWLYDEKISRHGLMRLCSLLWYALVCNSTVRGAICKVAPACSWNSLRYADLNCLCRVLLKDFCQIYNSHSSKIDKAYSSVKNKTPFSTFLDYKIDLDVNIKTVFCYEFQGQSYCTLDAVKEAVNKVYPSTNYNVSLIF